MGHSHVVSYLHSRNPRPKKKKKNRPKALCEEKDNSWQFYKSVEGKSTIQIQGFKPKYLFCNVIMKNTGKGIRSEIQDADMKECIIKAVILRWAIRAWSYWRTLVDSIEHGSVILTKGWEKLGIYVSIPHPSLAEAFLKSLTFCS